MADAEGKGPDIQLESKLDLTDPFVKIVAKLFMEIDTNNDGSISAAEWKLYQQSQTEEEITSENTEKSMASADVDNNKEIDFDEFYGDGFQLLASLFKGNYEGFAIEVSKLKVQYKQHKNRNPKNSIFRGRGLELKAQTISQRELAAELTQ